MDESLIVLFIGSIRSHMITITGNMIFQVNYNVFRKIFNFSFVGLNFAKMTNKIKQCGTDLKQSTL